MKVWVAECKGDKFPVSTSWTHAGVSDVRYQKGDDSDDKRSMELQFDIRFPSESKTYHIASNIPFSYYDIVKDVVQTEIAVRGP